MILAVVQQSSTSGRSIPHGRRQEEDEGDGLIQTNLINGALCRPLTTRIDDCCVGESNQQRSIIPTNNENQF